ncbi:uncharacterized protein BcabD6B2_02600 [Babesia caballi]|uniref:Uncharacterized protein n=1 Tax=Babesia caballi TaxID=5871 RepID=A0AAV4LN22_BABCB|nr:hypothetical protein, conserved [Babesia caballi]
MDDRRIVFDAGLDAYVDDGAHRPPTCRHSRQCLAISGGFHARQKYYTLPLACIQNHCRIDKWSLANDNSHLQLQCGISLQLVLNEMLTDGTITIHQYYEALNCFKQTVHDKLGHIKDLQFSHKRSMPVKLNGQLANYKNENKTWIFFLESVYISMGRLTLTSPSMKICATKAD